jgi:hypothetical protein
MRLRVDDFFDVIYYFRKRSPNQSYETSISKKKTDKVGQKE